MIRNHCLWFEAPGEVSVRGQDLASLQAGEYRVQTELSVVSSGTERLLLENAPGEAHAADTAFASGSSSSYPFPYGYQSVGRIVDQSADVEQDLLGRRVFSFTPHARFNNVPRGQLIPLPEEVSGVSAGLLANMETAVSLAWDLGPLFGEDVAIFGQGLLGLLVCRVLSQCGLRSIKVFDPNPDTLKRSMEFGASHAYTCPGDDNVVDRSIELSGHHKGLEDAVRATRSHGRIVCGSWYREDSGICLGTDFHRKRQSIVSSQVSSQNPLLGPHLSKERKIELAMSQLPGINIDALDVCEFTIEDAQAAYQQVLNRSGQLIVFKYPQ